MTLLTQTKLTSDILRYRKDHTLEETGKQFNLSSERIRQIEFEKHRKRCKIHNRLYYNRCSHCLVKHYKSFIRWSNYLEIQKQCDKEAKNRKRDFLSVQRRVILVQTLYDRWNNSFVEIANMLKRDRTTIMYLYNKNIDD